MGTIYRVGCVTLWYIRNHAKAANAKEPHQIPETPSKKLVGPKEMKRRNGVLKNMCICTPSVTDSLGRRNMKGRVSMNMCLSDARCD